MQQAIYCFTQAIKVDKEDVDTMWDRAVLLKLSDAKTMVRHLVAMRARISRRRELISQVVLCH